MENNKKGACLIMYGNGMVNKHLTSLHDPKTMLAWTSKERADAYLKTKPSPQHFQVYSYPDKSIYQISEIAGRAGFTKIAVNVTDDEAPIDTFSFLLID